MSDSELELELDRDREPDFDLKPKIVLKIRPSSVGVVEETRTIRSSSERVIVIVHVVNQALQYDRNNVHLERDRGMPSQCVV